MYVVLHAKRLQGTQIYISQYSTPTQPLEMVTVKLEVLCVMLKVPNLNNFAFFCSLITDTRHPCNASNCHQGYGNLQ